jgi:DNA modification methylase
MGSCSIGVAALNCHREFIGIENQLEHYKIAEERLEKYNGRPIGQFLSDTEFKNMYSFYSSYA